MNLENRIATLEAALNKAGVPVTRTASLADVLSDWKLVIIIALLGALIFSGDRAELIQEILR